MNGNDTTIPVLVIGAGGHARAVIALLRRLNREILACVDAAGSRGPDSMAGVPVLRGDDAVLVYEPNRVRLANGIGSIGAPTIRQAVFDRFKSHGYVFATLIDPAACVFDDAELGEGCQVLAGAVIQTGARLAENTLVNTRAVVEHDCRIGRHCHIAPGAIISGGVTLADGCHIGIAAAVLQGLSIGVGGVVGGGAAVINNVAAGETVIGVPARPLDNRT
jgi:sugar O-acyltransferase (sialic acid O-acetyltransferase NeuD family)